MALTLTLAACNTNPALNGPDGSDLPSTLDDQLRLALSFIAQLRDGAGIPTGALIPFPTATAPTGWVKANGALLSRTTYATLFAFASAQGLVTEVAWAATDFGRFSVGDGSTTFRVPDLRGMFLRGLDESRGVDTARLIGVDQAAANAPHTHGITDAGHTHAVNDFGHLHGGTTTSAGSHSHNVFSQGGIQGAGGSDPSFWVGNIASNTYGPRDTSTVAAHLHGITTSTNPTGITLANTATGVATQSQGTEGRPRNLAYPMFIKF
jgi:microcystin-dependent protein